MSNLKLSSFHGEAKILGAWRKVVFSENGELVIFGLDSESAAEIVWVLTDGGLGREPEKATSPVSDTMRPPPPVDPTPEVSWSSPLAPQVVVATMHADFAKPAAAVEPVVVAPVAPVEPKPIAAPIDAPAAKVEPATSVWVPAGHIPTATAKMVKRVDVEAGPLDLIQLNVSITEPEAAPVDLIAPAGYFPSERGTDLEDVRPIVGSVERFTEPTSIGKVEFVTFAGATPLNEYSPEACAEPAKQAPAPYDLEILRSAPTLAAVLRHLIARGVEAEADLVRICETELKSQVPLIARVVNLQERISKALFVMGAKDA